MLLPGYAGAGRPTGILRATGPAEGRKPRM